MAFSPDGMMLASIGWGVKEDKTARLWDITSGKEIRQFRGHRIGLNCIAFSPDENTLYVANSDPAKAIWMAFPIQADGTLGAGKLIHDSTAEVKAKKPGLPDGLKVDQKGNIFATGPDGVFVFAAVAAFATASTKAICCWT